ncbi:hypothetical protein BGX38DRAFT_1138273 [Terfezia claveryi]|nr:hypothetical protein BGX38DRAFT_1138273 [Terfezia claveryi]
MGSSLQRNPSQLNTAPETTEGYDAIYTGDSSNKAAIRSVTFHTARGSCLGSPADRGGQPPLSGPAEYEATQAQPSVPGSTKAGMLEHPVLISGCRDLHAGHGGHGSSINNVASIYEEIEFPICWEPYRTQAAQISSAEAPTGMDHDVEPLELYYQRMLGVDDLMQCHEPEDISEPDEDQGMLMMKSSNTTSKLRVDGAGSYAADALSHEHYEGQNYPKPGPQHIPQIHVQAVTPPDSKLALHVTQHAIATGRPSPAPAPIALITSNRLPENVGLATPEYTLVSQFNTPSPTSIFPRFIHREAREEGEQGFTPKLESFTNWPGNPSPRAQQKVSRAYAYHLRRNTSPDPDISDYFLRALIPTPVPLGGELTNLGFATIKDTDYPVAEGGPVSQDAHAKTVVLRGFDCPPENYIHDHFTKEALRCRWEISQSYTQWPKLKTPNRGGPFNEMEDICGIFLRQHQVRG